MGKSLERSMSIFSTDETFDERSFSGMILINLQKHLTKYLRKSNDRTRKSREMSFSRKFLTKNV